MGDIKLETLQSSHPSWRNALKRYKVRFQTDTHFKDYSGFSFTEEGFDVESQIRQRENGIIVDVGGPTRALGELFDIKNNSFKKIFTTNISKTVHPYESKRVDFQADGCTLPLSSNSVDVVFAEGVIPSLAAGFITEGARVLKHGGLMLIHSCTDIDIKKGEELGLEVKKIVNIDEDKDPGDLYLVMFQKSIIK